MISLRELRMWHWRNVMRYRQMAKDKRASAATQNSYNRQADFHIGCVQAMNDIPELQDTTAEHDCNRKKPPK